MAEYLQTDGDVLGTPPQVMDAPATATPVLVDGQPSNSPCTGGDDSTSPIQAEGSPTRNIPSSQPKQGDVASPTLAGLMEDDEEDFWLVPPRSTCLYIYIYMLSSKYV